MAVGATERWSSLGCFALELWEVLLNDRMLPVERYTDILLGQRNYGTFLGVFKQRPSVEPPGCCLDSSVCRFSHLQALPYVAADLRSQGEHILRTQRAQELGPQAFMMVMALTSWKADHTVPQLKKHFEIKINAAFF